jgi:hypothetical protein
MSILTISKDELTSRLKSLAWRLGMMILAVVVGFLIDNLGALNLSPAIVGILGLILGEISKQINNNVKELKAMAGQK